MAGGAPPQVAIRRLAPSALQCCGIGNWNSTTTTTNSRRRRQQQQRLDFRQTPCAKLGRGNGSGGVAKGRLRKAIARSLFAPAAVGSRRAHQQDTSRISSMPEIWGPSSIIIQSSSAACFFSRGNTISPSLDTRSSSPCRRTYHKIAGFVVSDKKLHTVGMSLTFSDTPMCFLSLLHCWAGINLLKPGPTKHVCRFSLSLDQSCWDF